MIERFYLKEYLSFKEVDLEFKNGLIVFTGPSGSGKSILMHSILSSLGIESCEASLCESTTLWQFDGEAFGIESEDVNIFKHLKKEKSRFFINSQSISRKAMSAIASKHLRHLSLKDFSDFHNENLIDLIDKRIALKNSSIKEIKKQYEEDFSQHQKLALELAEITSKEEHLRELKEYTEFEIEKIEKINPKIGEDEELLEIKKKLSKKEKVLEVLTSANQFFDNEHFVFQALDLLEEDSSFFSDAMNELRAILDGAEEKFSALEEIDIEEVLNRLEVLSDLKRRYGSVEEAIQYKETKMKELARYENIEEDRGKLEEQVVLLQQNIQALSRVLSDLRQKELKLFEKELNQYLQELYLQDAQIGLEEGELTSLGKDIVQIHINNTPLEKISTGEFNRLRLAILALKSEFVSTNGGVLMLDEIDANLSGEESMSVARVLRKLAHHFQIFVISHQPQLTSMGEQHFFVYKEDGISKVKELLHHERVNEIARIISGQNITNEAKLFAKELLETDR